MMVLKENALPGEFVKCRCVLTGDEVGPHSVPDDYDNVFGIAPGNSGGSQKNAEKNRSDDAHVRMSFQTSKPRVKPKAPERCSCGGDSCVKVIDQPRPRGIGGERGIRTLGTF